MKTQETKSFYKIVVYEDVALPRGCSLFITHIEK